MLLGYGTENSLQAAEATEKEVTHKILEYKVNCANNQAPCTLIDFVFSRTNHFLPTINPMHLPHLFVADLLQLFPQQE